MNPKHAPGPWRLDKDNLNVYANGLLATVFGHIHTGEKLANASLIAAAPEMLEALELAFAEMNNGVDYAQSGEPTPAQIAIRSAITKARGEI